MTIKATSVLAILVIWAAIIPAVALQGEVWWSLIFAALATGAVGINAWRRLGLSRVAAIGGAWGGTAGALAYSGDATWISVFAFLSTGAIVTSPMRREAIINGLGIAATWGLSGWVIAQHPNDAAWIAVFAFLTSAVVASSHGRAARGIQCAIAWGAATAVMLVTSDFYWLSVFAFLLSTFRFGGGISLPRRFEWDLFERDSPTRAEGTEPDVTLGSERG